MTAHVIVTLTVIDSAKLKQYSAAAGPTVAKFGGEFVGRGPLAVLHGETDQQVQVIIQFPTREDADNWYQSPEYQALIALRSEAMDALFTVIG